MRLLRESRWAYGCRNSMFSVNRPEFGVQEEMSASQTYPLVTVTVFKCGIVSPTVLFFAQKQVELQICFVIICTHSTKIPISKSCGSQMWNCVANDVAYLSSYKNKSSCEYASSSKIYIYLYRPIHSTKICASISYNSMEPFRPRCCFLNKKMPTCKYASSSYLDIAQKYPLTYSFQMWNRVAHDVAFRTKTSQAANIPRHHIYT